MSESRDLTGVWYGRYVSHVDEQDSGFIAVIEESGGVFSGTVSEPEYGGGVRRATVAGRRSGAHVRFVKQYHGRWTHAVLYDGIVDDQGTEVSGAWRVDWLEGGFSMQREKFSAEELEADIEESLELR